MSVIWRRIQRTNKKEYKFDVTVNYKSLRLVCSGKEQWMPDNLVVVWKRRGRRFKTEALQWPNVEGVTTNILAWLEDEAHTAEIMLFKESRSSTFDEKEWEFVLENVPLGGGGQRKTLGSCSLDLKYCAEADATCENELQLRLTPCTSKVKAIELEVEIIAKFLSEKASEGDDLSLSSITDDVPADAQRESDDEETGSPQSKMMVGGRQTSDRSESKCVMEHRKTVTTSRQEARFLLEQDDTSSEEDDFINTPMGELPPMEIPNEDELLDWSQRVTDGYRGVQIKNMTTSWRNGMAFCAIIHRFHPQLVDYPGLAPFEMVDNNKKAYHAAESIGVPRLLDPVQIVEREVPDKLSIMTYLFQLKLHLGDAADGMTAVTRYSKQNRNAIENVLADLRGCGDDESSVSSAYSEDSSGSSSSEEDSVGSDGDGDIALGITKWKIQKTPTVDPSSGQQANDVAPEEAPSTGELQQPNSNVDQENAATCDAVTALEGTVVGKIPSEKTATATSGYVPVNSMYAALDGDTASDTSPPLAVRSAEKTATDDRGLDDSAELEVFTASGSLVMDNSQIPAGIDQIVSSASTPNKPIVTKPKRTPDLTTYKRADSPDAVRKLQLLARARKAMEEKKQVSPKHSTSPVPKTEVVVRPAIASPMETEIDADLGDTAPRYNPFTTVKPVAQDNSVPTADDTEKPKKKKKKKRQEGEEGERKRKKKKKKKREREGEESVAGGDIRKKKKKKRKRSEAMEAATDVVEGCEDPKPVDSVSVIEKSSDKHAPSSTAADKPKRTRRVRQALPVAQSTVQYREQQAKEEAARLMDASADSKEERVRFQPASMSTGVEGWIPASRSMPRSPTTESDFLDTFEYAHYSLKAVEKQQADLDKRGHRVEMRLRQAMENGDTEATQRLTQQWFQLIAQKNILIRQTEDLDLVSRETDLEAQFELINRKLRQLTAVEDHKKSAEQVALEESLMAKMTVLVRERDLVAQRLHEREVMAQQEDERVEQAIQKAASKPAPAASHASAAAATGVDNEKPCTIM